MGCKGPAAATAHNTHCGRGWINSSEDGTLWCNPQPRIMEHRNLKDNTLSEQWAQEPQRAQRNGDSSHFLCRGLSSILRRWRRWRRAKTHSGFILTENEAVCGNKKRGRGGQQLCRRVIPSLHFTLLQAMDPPGGHQPHFFCISWRGEWVLAHIKIQRQVQIRGCGVEAMYRQGVGGVTLCVSISLCLLCVGQMWGRISKKKKTLKCTITLVHL